jgi:hypothetical protein
MVFCRGHRCYLFTSFIFFCYNPCYCPCALGIASPAALMMGSGKATQNGILFKEEYLEIAKRVKEQSIWLCRNVVRVASW